MLRARRLRASCAALRNATRELDTTTNHTVDPRERDTDVRPRSASPHAAPTRKLTRVAAITITTAASEVASTARKLPAATAPREGGVRRRASRVLRSRSPAPT